MNLQQLIIRNKIVNPKSIIKFHVIILMMLNASVYAQNHYWSQQYGAENTLLGGACIAGARDNSAMYYNPAGLGFVEEAK
ncbi:MAG: hypothetical protein IPF58_01410 [Saprospirales bacterium]|nr:hypothetical protein [Saprospirales bacterium]